MNETSIGQEHTNDMILKVGQFRWEATKNFSFDLIIYPTLFADVSATTIIYGCFQK